MASRGAAQPAAAIGGHPQTPPAETEAGAIQAAQPNLPLSPNLPCRLTACSITFVENYFKPKVFISANIDGGAGAGHCCKGPPTSRRREALARISQHRLGQRLCQWRQHRRRRPLAGGMGGAGESVSRHASVGRPGYGWTSPMATSRVTFSTFSSPKGRRRGWSCLSMADSGRRSTRAIGRILPPARCRAAMLLPCPPTRFVRACVSRQSSGRSPPRSARRRRWSTDP